MWKSIWWSCYTSVYIYVSFVGNGVQIKNQKYGDFDVTTQRTSRLNEKVRKHDDLQPLLLDEDQNINKTITI